MPSPAAVRRLSSLGAALLLGGALALPAAADPAQAQSFHRTLAYTLKIDGKEVPGGRFYLSDANDAYLIVGPSLPGAVLLDLHTKAVSTLAAPPAEKADGTLALPAGSERKAQGQFTVDGDAPVFAVDGKHVRLDEPAPLLKLQSAQSLRAYNPEYARRAAVYKPDPAVLSQIAKLKEPLRMRVYFGSWCPVCSNALPRLLKIMDALPGIPLTVELYGLPPGIKGDPEAARVNIAGLPTAIVYRKDQEIGRIVGMAWQRPEATLRAIVAP